MLKVEWAESQAWMNTAAELYKPAREILDGDRADPLRRYPVENDLNVAHVCAVYAFEILFKVLVQLSSKEPKAKHEPGVAWNAISEKYRLEIKRIALDHGWPRVGDFLYFLDNELCHRDRKYWMKEPDGGQKRMNVRLSGPGRIDALSVLHEKVSDFTLDLIESDSGAFEMWNVGNDVPNPHRARN